MSTTPMKICTRCTLPKPLGEFHRDATMADGHERRCKSCRAEIAADRYERKKEKILAECAGYYAAHRTEVLERNTQWKATHPELTRQASRKYRATLTAEQRQQINARRRERYHARKAATKGSTP